MQQKKTKRQEKLLNYGQLNGLADAPDDQSALVFIYYQQRLMIVEQGASAAEVLDKSPELLSIEGMDQHFNKLMENKIIYLMGDFNINLLALEFLEFLELMYTFIL